MIPAEKIRAEALKHDAISNQEGKQGLDGLGYANPNGEQAGLIVRSRCGHLPPPPRGRKEMKKFAMTAAELEAVIKVEMEDPTDMTVSVDSGRHDRGRRINVRASVPPQSKGRKFQERIKS